MVTYEVVRDSALADRNRDNYLRWADAWCRCETPPDLRSCFEQEDATLLHARAHALVDYARKLHAARFRGKKIVPITLWRSR